jgi:hypothetical protein
MAFETRTGLGPHEVTAKRGARTDGPPRHAEELIPETRPERADGVEHRYTTP